MERPFNNLAWLFLAPALVVVLFSVGIPLLSVVNFSVQDVFFGNNFVWGVEAKGSRVTYIKLENTLPFVF